MTLMPVTRIAASVDWSMNSGALAWIAAVCSAPTGPRSSIGSPTTFMMRPRVLGPTGTEICAPVLVTGWPRVRPSVASIAMVRTVFSPRCWATSSTRRLPLLSVSSAVRIAGSSPSKVTSTTAPMTWLILPLVVSTVAMLVSLPSISYSASAPAIISMSSVVIAAWRLRLYWMVSFWISSPALRVALSIAVIDAPCSLAEFSSKAPKIWMRR